MSAAQPSDRSAGLGDPPWVADRMSPLAIDMYLPSPRSARGAGAGGVVSRLLNREGFNQAEPVHASFWASPSSNRQSCAPNKWLALPDYSGI